MRYNIVQPGFDVFVQCTSSDITFNVNQTQISVDMIRRVYDNWRKRLKLINLSKDVILRM